MPKISGQSCQRFRNMLYFCLIDKKIEERHEENRMDYTVVGGTAHCLQRR